MIYWRLKMGRAIFLSELSSEMYSNSYVFRFLNTYFSDQWSVFSFQFVQLLLIVLVGNEKYFIKKNRRRKIWNYCIWFYCILYLLFLMTDWYDLFWFCSPWVVTVILFVYYLKLLYCFWFFILLLLFIICGSGVLICNTEKICSRMAKRVNLLE